MWILRKNSTRTPLVLRKFQTILRNRWIVGNIESVLSTWCLLLRDDIFSQTQEAEYFLNFVWTFRNQPQRHIERRLDSVEIRVLACDQILSQMNCCSHRSWHIVPRSIHWSSGRTSHRLPFGSTFDEDSWRFSQRTCNLWLAGYGGPTLSFVVGFQFHIAVSPQPYELLGMLPSTQSRCNSRNSFEKGRELQSVQVSFNQTHWPRLCFGRFFFRLPFLNSLRHGGCLFNRTTMATRGHGKIHDVNQTKKITPVSTRETASSQQVSELVFGVNIFDFGFLGPKLILSHNQSHATPVGSRHLSHRWTLSFDDHLDHSFVVFRRMCVCGHTIWIWQLIKVLITLFLQLDVMDSVPPAVSRGSSGFVESHSCDE